jgi:hypothetical protein
VPPGIRPSYAFRGFGLALEQPLPQFTVPEMPGVLSVAQCDALVAEERAESQRQRVIWVVSAAVAGIVIGVLGTSLYY